MKSIRRAVATACIALLAACGGGGGGDDKATATDAEVIALVAGSNIDAGRIGATWRWPGDPARIDVYLEPPAIGNATEADHANKARQSVAAINRKMTGLLVLQTVDAVPAGGHYIHVSYGTAYVPPDATNFQNYCANVATARNTGTPISPAPDGTVASQPVYVNLGNGRCNLSQEIVTHEFGHALGLGGHFDGFGMGDAISPAYWDVLATLYANPPLTARDGLTVRRAAD